MSIKIINGALDEGGTSSSDSIVIRGIIDPVSLDQLETDTYQREVEPLAKISALVKAMEAGDRMPDVELGMRGSKTVFRDGFYFLQDRTFIVDGLQRITAAKQFRLKGGQPRLGALVHLNTTEPWERERFRILNQERMKVSSNIILRNMRLDVDVVQMLFALAHDKEFVMCEKICWAQRMRRQDLINALTLMKTVGALHSHMGPGRSNQLTDLARGLQKILVTAGRTIMRDNVKTFFDLVDSAWGIKRVAFKEGAAYLRQTFLWCLATILSQYEDFWRGSRLFIEADLLRKIAQFPVADPEVSRLASSSGKSRELLHILMLEHINRGKTTRRLRRRPDTAASSNARAVATSELVGAGAPAE